MAGTWGLPPGLYNQIAQLANQNKLSGIAPGVLASIVYTEGRTPGLPTYGGSPPNVPVTNNEGTFQGWYDLQPGATYVNGAGQSFTASTLGDTSSQSFALQTQTAAAALSGYMANGMDLPTALEHYSGSSNAYDHYTQNGGQASAGGSGGEGGSSSSSGGSSNVPSSGMPSSSSAGSPSTASSTAGGGVLGDCSGCLVNVPLVGCMISQCNAKAIVGGLLVAAGGLGIVVGIVVMVKASSPLGALSRVLSSGGSSRSSSSLSSTTSAPVEEVQVPAPGEDDYDLPAAPPVEGDDMDRELSAYYAGVEAGLEAPRTSKRQVGVMHDADEGEF